MLDLIKVPIESKESGKIVMMFKKSKKLGMGLNFSKMILRMMGLSIFFFIMLLSLSAYAFQVGGQKKMIQANPVVPANQAAQQQMLPVKISFSISPSHQYFWGAMMSDDGNFSWVGPPKKIIIRVGIGGPVYEIFESTTMPFAINTGDVNYKFVGGSDVLVAVQVIATQPSGINVANKLYTVKPSNSVFNITLMGPTQPLVYKPVFNP